MNHSDHSWENCPELNPAPKSEAAQWYPLLRWLRAAGWEHIRYGRDDAVEHVWERNRHAQNAQKISVEAGVASIEIADVMLSGAGLTPDQCHAILAMLGAFLPAPEPVWRRSESVDTAVGELVATVVEKAFAAAQLIDRRPL